MDETIILQKKFQINMKCVHLSDVYKYTDSDVWLQEEFSAKILLISPSFLGYNNKRCIKVINNVVNNIISINLKNI